MTFLTELERLKGAATKGPYLLVKGGGSGRPTIIGDGFNCGRPTIAEFCNDPEGWADAKSFLLFLDHADALAELVRAAEDMLSGWSYIRSTYGDLPGVGWDRAEDKVSEALAKLNGEGE